MSHSTEYNRTLLTEIILVRSKNVKLNPFNFTLETKMTILTNPNNQDKEHALWRQTSTWLVITTNPTD